MLFFQILTAIGAQIVNAESSMSYSTLEPRYVGQSDASASRFNSLSTSSSQSFSQDFGSNGKSDLASRSITFTSTSQLSEKGSAPDASTSGVKSFSIPGSNGLSFESRSNRQSDISVSGSNSLSASRSQRLSQDFGSNGKSDLASRSITFTSTSQLSEKGSAPDASTSGVKSFSIPGSNGLSFESRSNRQSDISVSGSNSLSASRSQRLSQDFGSNGKSDLASRSITFTSTSQLSEKGSAPDASTSGVKSFSIPGSNGLSFESRSTRQSHISVSGSNLFSVPSSQIFSQDFGQYSLDSSTSYHAPSFKPSAAPSAQSPFPTLEPTEAEENNIEASNSPSSQPSQRQQASSENDKDSGSKDFFENAWQWAENNQNYLIATGSLAVMATISYCNKDLIKDTYTQYITGYPNPDMVPPLYLTLDSSNEIMDGASKDDSSNSWQDIVRNANNTETDFHAL